jgi:hypothetical protein
VLDPRAESTEEFSNRVTEAYALLVEHGDLSRTAALSADSESEVREWTDAIVRGTPTAAWGDRFVYVMELAQDLKFEIVGDHVLRHGVEAVSSSPEATAALDHLHEFIAGRDHGRRLRATWALGMLGKMDPGRAGKMLEPLAEGEDRELQCAALLAISGIRQLTEAETELLRRVAETSPLASVRDMVREALRPRPEVQEDTDSN